MDTILGILSSESYSGIRALVDLSMCVKMYQQAASVSGWVLTYIHFFALFLPGGSFMHSHLTFVGHAPGSGASTLRASFSPGPREGSGG